MPRYPQLRYFLSYVTVLVLLVVLAWVYPLGRERQWLYRLTVTQTPPLSLAVGHSVQQSLTPPGGTIKAVRFLVTNKRLTGALHVRLLDTTGQERARAYGYLTSYVSDTREGTYMAVTAFIPWQKLQPKEKLYVEITRVSGEPLQLVTVGNTNYKSQTLTSNQVTIPNEVLAFLLIRPTVTPAGLKYGVATAAGFMLVVSIVYWWWPRLQPYRWWILSGLFVIITPLTLAGFWLAHNPLGIDDWDYYFSLHHIWRQTVLTFHQFPLWNPYTCGGTAALGDPEFSVLTPTFIGEFLFNVPTGLRLAIDISVAMGALGILQLAKRLGLSWLAAATAAIVAVYGTVNLLEMVEGHVDIYASMWIPWIFWAWLGAYQRRDRLLNGPTIWLSLFLALTFYQGGIYLLLYTLLAFLVLPFLVKRPWQAIKVTTIGGVIALGLAGIKLIPVLLWLHQFPDQGYASAPTTIWSIASILFGRYIEGANLVPNQVSGWHEYGAYVGIFAFALALIGVTRWRQDRIVRGLAIAAVLALLLSTAGPLLEPFFNQMPYLPRSMISRVILFTVIPLGLLAGYGWDLLVARWRWGKAIALVVLTLICVDIFSLSYQLSQQAFVVPLDHPDLPPVQAPISFTRRVFYSALPTGEQHIAQYPVTLLGYGELNYCSVLGPNSHVTTIEDQRPQGYVITNPSADTTVVRWTPNQVVVKVTASEPTQVILNTNYAEGWEVNHELAQAAGNRVSTLVTAGDHTLTFEYHAPGLLTGSGLTVVTVVGLLYFLMTAKRDKAKASQTPNKIEMEKVVG